MIGSLFTEAQRGERPAPFDFLPHEAVQRVFDFLPLRALCRASQACRYFAEVGGDFELWRGLLLQAHPSAMVERSKHPRHTFRALSAAWRRSGAGQDSSHEDLVNGPSLAAAGLVLHTTQLAADLPVAVRNYDCFQAADPRVSDWLSSLGLDKYVGLFARKQVHMDALRLMGDGELHALGVSMSGSRKKMLSALEA